MECKSSLDALATDIVQRFVAEKRIIPGLGHPVHKPIDPRTPRLFEIAAENGISGRVIVQFAVSNPDIPTTLVSTPLPEQIIENIQWASEEPDWELVDAVREIIEPVFNKDWIVG